MILISLLTNAFSQTTRVSNNDVEGIYIAVLPGMKVEESVALTFLYVGKMEALVISSNGLLANIDIDINGNVTGTLRNVSPYTLERSGDFIKLSTSTTSLVGTAKTEMLFDPKTSVFAIGDVSLPNGLSAYEDIFSTLFSSGITFHRIRSANGIAVR
jgi:hypothetical protein